MTLLLLLLLQSFGHMLLRIARWVGRSVGRSVGARSIVVTRNGAFLR